MVSEKGNGCIMPTWKTNKDSLQGIDMDNLPFITINVVGKKHITLYTRIRSGDYDTQLSQIAARTGNDIDTVKRQALWQAQASEDVDTVMNNTLTVMTRI